MSNSKNIYTWSQHYKQRSVAATKELLYDAHPTPHNKINVINFRRRVGNPEAQSPKKIKLQ